MRLSPEHVRLIRETIDVMLGSDARITLFGSRLYDDMRGGDVDLMIAIAQRVDNVALLSARIAARLERLLGGRRVDVILVTPETAAQPIHKIAREQGISL